MTMIDSSGAVKQKARSKKQEANLVLPFAASSLNRFILERNGIRCDVLNDTRYLSTLDLLLRGTLKKPSGCLKVPEGNAYAVLLLLFVLLSIYYILSLIGYASRTCVILNPCPRWYGTPVLNCGSPECPCCYLKVRISR
jgi:hypothetical protein